MRYLIALLLAATATPALAQSMILGAPNWLSIEACYVAPIDTRSGARYVLMEGGNVVFANQSDGVPEMLDADKAEVVCGDFSCLVDKQSKEIVAVISDRSEYSMVIQIDNGADPELWSATCDEDLAD